MGVENFGAPLTESFLDQGMIVQYFERARFELHVQNPDSYRVLLSLLGLQYGITDSPMRREAIPLVPNPAFRYFPETGQMIGLAIKEYFDRHGGVDVFGYPISLLRYESGKFVQYFQRARVEWDPADSSPNRVRVSAIGQVALDKRSPSLIWRARAVNDWCPEHTLANLPRGIAPPAVVALSTPVPPTTTLSLQVRVHFRQTGPTGPQYVDVLVLDQNGKPFAGAALYATIRFQNGERVIPLMPSDAQGKSFFSFDIGTQPPGSTTIVEVTAAAGTLSATGRDAFTR
jgi:hypothetical protein